MRRSAAFLAATALFAILAPLPAAAKEQSAPAAKAGEVAARLNDPMTQFAVAGMISAMSKAMLDMPVAPFVDAMEKVGGKRMGNLPRDARVADLAGTDQERVREQLVEHVPRAMAALGGMAGAFEALAPELERLARQMRDSLPKR